MAVPLGPWECVPCKIGKHDKTHKNLGIIYKEEGTEWKGASSAVVTMSKELAEVFPGCVAFAVNDVSGVLFYDERAFEVPGDVSTLMDKDGWTTYVNRSAGEEKLPPPP